MCGIVGYITLADDTIVREKSKFLTEALFADTLRGWDSTGLMYLHDKFTWGWQKQAVAASEFILTKGYNDRERQTWCAIGHNRAATVGEVTTDNAHPFQHEDIILVHNGTLRSQYDLLHKNRKITVDSDLIAYNLSKVPPEEAKDVISRLMGAYALVWFDVRDKSVNMVRNHERPLHLGIPASSTALYIASDGHLLNFIGNRMNAHKPEKIWQLATHQILKYKKGSLVPEVTPVVPFVDRSWEQRTTHTHHTYREKPSWDSQTKNGPNYSTITEDTRRTMPGGRAAKNGRAIIANTLREIPQPMVEILDDWYQLESTDELCFEPTNFQPFGHRLYGMTYGKVWHPEWQTWLDACMPDGTEHSHKNRTFPWTGCPIGVNHTSLSGISQHECTIILRLLNYKYTGKMPSEMIKPIDTDEEGLVEELVPGPHGDITIEAFDYLAQDGCVMCQKEIDVTDADDVVWVGEMSNQPMCGACLDEATKEGGFAEVKD